MADASYPSLKEFAAMPSYRRDMYRRYHEFPSDDELPEAPVPFKSKVSRRMLFQAVYFIRAAKGPIKIGIASNVKRRLAALQIASPVRLRLLVVIPGGREVELAYHARFAAHRLYGEWFRPHPDILAVVAELRREVDSWAIDERTRRPVRA